LSSEIGIKFGINSLLFPFVLSSLKCYIILRSNLIMAHSERFMYPGERVRYNIINKVLAEAAIDNGDLWSRDTAVLSKATSTRAGGEVSQQPRQG
jgi:hypothetical protein